MKTLLAIVMISSLVVPSNVWAADSCPQPVYHLLPGNTVPCEGFLFSLEKEAELEKINEQYKLLETQVQVQQQLIDLYKTNNTALQSIADKEEQKANLWRITAEDNTKKLIEKDDRTVWRDVGFFVLGCAVVSLGAWAAGQHKK